MNNFLFTVLLSLLAVCLMRVAKLAHNGWACCYAGFYCTPTPTVSPPDSYRDKLLKFKLQTKAEKKSVGQNRW